MLGMEARTRNIRTRRWSDYQQLNFIAPLLPYITIFPTRVQKFVSFNHARDGSKDQEQKNKVLVWLSTVKPETPQAGLPVECTLSANLPLA